MKNYNKVARVEKRKVLVIPTTAQVLATQIPDADFTLADRVTEEHKDFDTIFSYHTFQNYAWQDAGAIIKLWRDALKKRGDIHLFVPSLEWLAEQVNTEKPTPLLKYYLFRPSGWMMFDLRGLLANYFNVRTATEAEFTIELNGREEVGIMHYIYAVTK